MLARTRDGTVTYDMCNGARVAGKSSAHLPQEAGLAGTPWALHQHTTRGWRTCHYPTCRSLCPQHHR